MDLAVYWGLIGSLDQNPRLLAEATSEVFGEDVERAHILRIVGQEIGERESGLQLGEAPEAGGAEHERHDQGRDGGILG